MTDEELLADVVAAPTDDGPRIVYADWLQQHDDAVERARGEYIALACSTQRSPARSARMQALLDAHEPAWLGPFADCTTQRVWSRGFVDACMLDTVTPAVMTHRAWRTLRLLDARPLVAAPAVDPTEIPRLPTDALKSLAVPAHFIGALAESAASPRVVELAIGETTPSQWDAHGAIAARLAEAPCFAKVRRLHVTARWTPGLATGLARAGLTLAVIAAPTRIGTWLDALDDRQPDLEEVRLVDDILPLLVREGIELVIRRDGARWSHLEVRWSERDDYDLREETLRALAALQRPQLTRVTFVGPDRAAFDVARWRTRVRQALRAQIAARFE